MLLKTTLCKTANYNSMKISITILSLLFISNLFGQTINISPSWHEVEKGNYQLQSLNKVAETKKIIDPQLSIDSLNDNTAYLIPTDKGVLLFKTNTPTTKSDIAGKLTSNSLIELLEVDYRKTYENPDTSWKYSHEVWYKLRINNQVYYTDYKVHSITYNKALIKFNQVISITSQDTGYDNYYDKGYPEHFHLLVFDRKEDELTLIFDSQELKLKCNCEFWETEMETLNWKVLEHGSLSIILNGHEQMYEAIWDSEKLIEK